MSRKLYSSVVKCPICGGDTHVNRDTGDFTCDHCGKIVVRANKKLAEIHVLPIDEDDEDYDNEDEHEHELDDSEYYYHPRPGSYTQPGLFTEKSVNIGPNVVQDYIPEPMNNEDLFKHLKEHSHPGLDIKPNSVDPDLEHYEYHYDNNENPDLEHTHELNTGYGPHGVDVEDLLGHQEHPNMRLPIEAMSPETKRKHYIEEHGYPVDTKSPKYWDVEHRSYHSQTLLDNPGKSEREWDVDRSGYAPAYDPMWDITAHVAKPHEHWAVQKEEDPEVTKARDEKIENLLSDVEDLNKWQEQRRQWANPTRESSKYTSTWPFTKNAAQPEEFDPEIEYPSGLPRPHYRMDEESQFYPRYHEHEYTRRFYPKVPVPWNTRKMDRNVPDFDKDAIPISADDLDDKWVQPLLNDTNRGILEQNSESYREHKCPMCGGKFEDNEPAVIYTNSNIVNTISDWLPYHEHCMRLVNIHCPHMRREISDEPYNHIEDAHYVTGPYAKLREQGVKNYIEKLNHIANFTDERYE